MSKSDKRQLETDISNYTEEIYYSARYYDDEYEYRHVNVPKQIARWMPEGQLMSELEWRSFGLRQSPGWVHYMIHNPEPHILMFRREKNFQIKYPHKAEEMQALIDAQQDLME